MFSISLSKVINSRLVFGKFNVFTIVIFAVYDGNVEGASYFISNLHYVVKY